MVNELSYRCTICGRVKNVKSESTKTSIKSKCPYCGKKTRLKLLDTYVDVGPITNFCSSYTLAADMTIANNHVHVRGLKVKGNVKIIDSEGSSLEHLTIGKNKEKAVSGNLNVDKSKVGSVDQNIVAGDINVRSSEVTSINQNMLGFSFDKDEVVIEIVNKLFTEKLPTTAELHRLQEILSGSHEIAEKLGARLNKENVNKHGVIGSVILKSLKKLGLDTLEKAKTIGLGELFKWLMLVIGINI